MQIAVLAVPDLFDSGLSAVLDILATANALRADLATSVPPFDVTVTGAEAAVRTGHGLRLATTPLSELDTLPELLVMPAVGCGLKSPRQVVDIVRNHPALAHVAALHAAGSDLAAACTGTFFLAEAGVLDGLLATTSWWLLLRRPGRRGWLGGAAIPRIAALLSACGSCGEDFEGVLAAVTGEAD
jgi:transcriptional regulator GlxA family with amidase domain